jgi:alpha-glucosidase
MVTEDLAGIDNLLWHHSHSDPGRFAPLNINFSGLHWDAQTIRQYVEEYETRLNNHEWPNHPLGSHDLKRIINRTGTEHQLPIAAVLQMTLRGMPIIYYGEEIGMHNVKITKERVQDPVTNRDPNYPGRDPERTPMQWDNSPNAGFTTVEPWLPVADDYNVINVAAEQQDPDSLLNLYKKLIVLRKTIPALELGDYRTSDSNKPDVYCYWRVYENQEVLVVLNMSFKDQSVDLGNDRFNCLLNTESNSSHNIKDSLLQLRPHQGLILEKLSD